MDSLHCICGKRILFFISLLLQLITKHTDAYCWGAGRNPGFSGEPKVEQISILRVRVSWEGIVTQRDCADSFLVKSWKQNDPQDYKLSELVDKDANYMNVDVLPRIYHEFQVIAREDKGLVLGVDYNKSKAVKYKTSTANKNKPIDPNERQDNKPPSTDTETNGNEDEDNTGLGLSIEMLVIVIVLGVILLLIIAV